MNKCPNCHSTECPCVNYAEFPCDCPKQIPTRRFTSPNSPLPPDELDELQRCIEAANDLLRSLGNESDPNNKRQLQLHLLNLRGVCVKVKLKGGESRSEDKESDAGEGEAVIEKTGTLVTAGRNFIQLNILGNDVFILYERLILLSREDCPKHEQPKKEKVTIWRKYYLKWKKLFRDFHKWFFRYSREKLRITKHHLHDEQEFLHADRTNRRKLVLNFGDFVSKDPELVNLFFGLSLHMHLEHYLGKDIKVKTDDSRMMEGILYKVESERIKVKNSNKSKEINMNEICFLEIINNHP